MLSVYVLVHIICILFNIAAFC